MFSRRHTSALSIHPSEVCGSNFCRTCTARADNSFSLSRRAVHVFSPIQITCSIVLIVFQLIIGFNAPRFLPHLIYSREWIAPFILFPASPFVRRFAGFSFSVGRFTRPVSGAPCLSLVSLCGRFPAVGLCFCPQYISVTSRLYRFAIRCHRQSLIVRCCPFPLQDITALQSLNGCFLRNVSGLRTGGSLWQRLAPG